MNYFSKKFLLLLFFLPILSFSQNKDCGKAALSFEAIDLNCILQNNYQARFKKIQENHQKQLENLEKLKKDNESTTDEKIKRENLKKIEKIKNSFNLVFAINSKDRLKKLRNHIFFYKTGHGHFGKMIIKNISATGLQCSIYAEIVTYQGSKAIDKAVTFVSENKSSSWNVDRMSFDDQPGSDFMLLRENGVCLFKGINGLMSSVKQLADIEEEDENGILVYAALFLIGLAVFLVARTVFQDEDRFKAQEKLEDAEQAEKQDAPNDIVLKYSRPFFKRYFSPIVQGMKNKRKIREKYKRPLASSGMNKFLSPEDFYAFKLFLIIGFPILYLGLRWFLEETWPLMYTPAISIFGYFYPDIWIKGKIDQRRQNVIENMPFIVDMLALSVEAGLDFVAAMQKVIEKAPPSALVEEFETFIKETKVGSSRADGLRQLAWRIDSLPISSFCATLIAADSVGANIGPILKTLAQELREKRSAMAEQKGAQAATKILIPMIFLVLPAVLIVIAAPIALQLMGG